MNEFFEWRLEKVSNCWLRSVGSNYDTRLDINTALNEMSDSELKTFYKAVYNFIN